MTKLEFWQQKLIQFFHDPPGKPFSFSKEIGGHEGLASAIFNAVTGQEADLDRINHAPDHAAAGADRPVLEKPGKSWLLDPHFTTHPELTHPLANTKDRPRLIAVHADGT